MTDDEAKKQVAALRKLNLRREYMESGANAYRVRMRITGSITYLVRANDPTQAENKAWDRYEAGEDPDVDETEMEPMSVHVEKCEPETLADMLKLPRDDV